MTDHAPIDIVVGSPLVRLLAASMLIAKGFRRRWGQSQRFSLHRLSNSGPTTTLRPQPSP